jgi:hypothetical protein
LTDKPGCFVVQPSFHNGILRVPPAVTLHLELGLHNVGLAAAIERLGIVTPFWMQMIVWSPKVFEPSLIWGRLATHLLPTYWKWP